MIRRIAITDHDTSATLGAYDHLYSRASPSQGPFLDLSENAPAEGLGLIRVLVEHATDWQRERYREARRPFPRVTIPFPEGRKILRRRLVRLLLGPQHYALNDHGIGAHGFGGMGASAD